MTNHLLDRPLMNCGHVAQSVTPDGSPACVICVGVDPGATMVAEKPSLEGRKAQCPYCKVVTPSEYTLAFFEYQGEGSRVAAHRCECGFADVAHAPLISPDHPDVAAGRRRFFDHDFKPNGALPFDSFYCGCRGWD